jgi:hypothetical protein
MQEAIIEKALVNEGAAGKITVTGSKGNLSVSCDPWDFDLAGAANGEIVVRVDWSAVANHLLKGVTAQEVAAAIAPKIYEGQNGQAPLSELPIHLIGHSRGGGMVYELARLLGEQGIEVEQVTSLDPHPLTTSDAQGLSAPWGPGSTIDTPVQVYENILFADNYWQNISYPEGEYVNGTYNRGWTDLSGGYHNHSNTAYSAVADHLNIHLLYDGTVDLDTPVSDNQASLDSSERSGWFNSYESEGVKTGFYYSRIYGGDRKSTDTPVEDGDRVIDGYNNDALLDGAGERQTLAWSNAAWPNIITLDVLRDGISLGAGSQTINIGEELELACTYNDYDSESTVRFYADQDCNPYNDNNLGLVAVQSLSSTGSDIEESSTSWQTTSLSTGDYYVYAAINDGSRTRYLYAPQTFKEAAPSVLTLDQPAKPVLNNKTVTWTAVANENNGYTLRIYKDGVPAGTVNIDHGAALSYDLSSLLVTSGTYTVTVTALGTGSYTDSPQSEPSAALYILNEGESDGQIQLPVGVTSLPVNGEGSIDLSSGIENAVDNQVIISGQTVTLDDYTGGDLNNMDLSGSISIGDQTVEIQKAVRLESGIDGSPITLTNSELENLFLTIPDGTALLMPAGWDGTVRVPQLVANTTAGPSGYTVGDNVYEMGNPDAIILFDRPVVIEIKGTSKPMAYKLSGSDTWLQITQEAEGTYDHPTAPEFPGEAYISNGTDTKIITWHLTAFADLEEEAVDECFIATACFGSKFEAHVALLRQFRDRFLLTNEAGKKFVAFYYKNSPPIAAMIAGNDVLKLLTRIILLPVISIAYVSFHPLSALMIFLACLLLLIGRRKYRLKRV